MHDPCFVRRRKGTCHLRSYFDCLARGDCSLAQSLAQRLPFDVLGGYEMAPVYLPHLIDGHYVRMV